MHNSIKVFAPASVANVAVGYDILGFALEKPGDDILVKKSNNPGLKVVEIRGAKGKLPYEIERNTAAYAAQQLLRYLGEEKAPIDMYIHKKMPFGSGMGSSAASAAAGVFAVNEMMKTGLSKREILRFAVQGEQVADGAYHADNVAPSLMGGMVLIRDNQSLDVKKLHIPPGLCVTIIHPHVKVLTKESREILSDHVPLEKVIQQAGNLGAFVAAMFTSDMDLLSRCVQDVIIEPQRARLIPHFYPLKEMALMEGALGFSISGAGPAMFALCANSLIAERIKDKAEKLLASNHISNSCFTSGINQEGAFRY